MKALFAPSTLFIMGGILLGVFVFFTLSTSEMDSKSSMPKSTVAVMKEERREAPPGWKEFRNSQYRFSILIPENLMPVFVPGEKGSATFIFEDEAGEQGFQMFIAQYLENQVSEERFRMDLPSGIRRDMKDITIDGALGASFFSEHEQLGETAEIWFVQHGYLYEVTTLKPLATWLSEIIQTWEFIY